MVIEFFDYGRKIQEENNIKTIIDKIELETFKVLKNKIIYNKTTCYQKNKCNW